MTAQGITPDEAARALVVAARRFGLRPTEVFASGRRGAQQARQMAACAVDAMGPLGPDRPRLNKQRLAAVFRLHFSALSPSKREKAGITTDDLLTVAEAVRGGAPAPEARPAGRRASSHARSPKPEARSPKPGGAPGGRGRQGRTAHGGGLRDAEAGDGSGGETGDRHAGCAMGPRGVAELFDVDADSLLSAIEARS